MKTRSTIWLVLSSLLVVSLILSACQTPTPEVITQPGETIVETVIITEIVEGTPVERIVTVVVTPEPAPEVTPAPIDRQGAWLDTIIMVEEPSADAAVSRLEVGDIDLYAFAIASPDTAANIMASPNLTYARAFGNHDELTFNPCGPVFETTGALNPYAVPRMREAMNWLVDREYIAQELYGGMAVPRWFNINNASNDYAAHADVAKALERTYGYNPDLAREVITEEMEALGATLTGGVWTYEGSPVEIIVLIRTEDTRRQIGDYVGNQLEDIGFTVVRDYRTAAEAGAIWLNADPCEGRFHIYTGGWISTAVPRDLGWTFAYFYTDTGRAEPLWQAYENDPEFYEIAIRLDTNDFRTLEERSELFARALELAMQDSVRFWLVDRAPIYPMRQGVSVASDLYGGPSGSWIWMETIRREGEVGGSMTIALPSILTAPWNPLDGSNWIFDMMVVRALGWTAYRPDLYTGLYWPYYFERAEVFVEEGLPVGQTLDWVTLTFEPEITVPDDTWVHWDAAEQRFITAGELNDYIAGLDEEQQEVFQNRYGDFLEDRRTASRNVVHYPADLYDTVTWHDGSPFSIGDILMYMILTLDRGNPDSVIYDSTKAPALSSFLSAFRGVRILSEDPLVLETYTDNYQLDAEININTWWPAYAQGGGPWHMLALGIFAEAEELGAFSPGRAEQLNVDRFSYVAGPTIEILRDQLTAAQEEGRMPYEPTFSEYISADEVEMRYANMAEWHRARGHLWVGNGPYFLQRAFPVEGTVILQRFTDFPFPADRWDVFTEPIIPVVEVDGPARVAPGTEATFDVFVTFQDEPYALEDITEVKYLVFDATGELVHVGAAEAVDDGLWELTLSSELTTALGTGSNLLEVIVVSNLVALPVSDTITFVTAQ
jgi:peptide/nickel transport system substrate-binding protein